MSTDNDNQEKTPPVVVGVALALTGVGFFLLAAAIYVAGPMWAAVPDRAERVSPVQAPAQTIPVQSSSEVEPLYTVTIDGVEFDVACDGTTLLYVGRAYHGMAVVAVGDSPKCQD